MRLHIAVCVCLLRIGLPVMRLHIAVCVCCDVIAAMNVTFVILYICFIITDH